MNLKTYLFNKMIIKSDLKRFWWVSALNTLAILIFAVYTRFERYIMQSGSYRYMPKVGVKFEASPVYTILTICIPILIAFGGFTAIMLSLHLNSANSVSFMHGLPLKRKTHYASHYLSGVILISAPAIINAVVMLLMRFNGNIAANVEVSHVFKWLYLYLLYVLVVYSGTVFLSLITGNAFASIGITGAVAVLPLVITGFLMKLFSDNVYGYYGYNIEKWLNYVYIGPLWLLKPYAFIYIALVLALVVGGYFVYKARHMENNGEVIAFPKLKPVFVYAVAIIIGFLGYMYVTAVSSNASMLWILGFGLLGVIIAYMLSKKAFTLKGAFKPALIFTAFFAILFCTVKFDLTGYEKRIPDVDEIEGVTVQNGGFGERTTSFFTSQYGEVIYKEVNNAVLTDKEDIENVIALHKHIVENREREIDKQYISLPISYKLKNGNIISRQYAVSREDCNEYLKKLFETEEMKAADYMITDSTEKTVIEVTASDSRLPNGTIAFYENDREMIDRFTEALKKDIENLKYEDNYERNQFVTSGMTRVTFRYSKPAKTLNGEELTSEQLKEIARRENYIINANYKNLTALLNEIGFYANLPKSESITALGINYYNETPGDRERVVGQSYTESGYYASSDIKIAASDALSGFQIKVENLEDAQAIYKLATEEAMYDNSYGYHNINLGFMTDKGIWQCTLNYDKIPEIISKYLKE